MDNFWYTYEHMFDPSTSLPQAYPPRCGKLGGGPSPKDLIASNRPTFPNGYRRVQQIDQVLIPIEKIDPGMFPTEMAVTVRGYDGKALTLFADRRLIEERAGQRFLRVTRVETDPTSGISVCLLPVDAAEGTRWIRIRNDELKAA